MHLLVVTLIVATIAVVFTLWLGLRYLSHCNDDLPEAAVLANDIMRRVSIEDAHRIMQQYRNFPAESCEIKRRAYWTLVDAGHIKPSVRAERTAR